MTHAYHEGQPGYSPAQVLFDGCEECTQRSTDPSLAIGSFDPFRFAAAWRRAAEWKRGNVPDASDAEVPVFEALWAVQVQLERLGVPIGTVPSASLHDLLGGQS